MIISYNQLFELVLLAAESNNKPADRQFIRNSLFTAFQNSELSEVQCDAVLDFLNKYIIVFLLNLKHNFSS